MTETTMTKMNPEIKAKWLEALRSGKYNQGENMLHRKDDEGKSYFCCLGVLCAIEGVSSELVSHNDIGPYYLFTEEDFSSPFMPGLNWLDSRGINDHEANKLASMNDNGGSFEEIADYIERYL